MTTPPLHIEHLGQSTSQTQDIVVLHGWGVNSGIFAPLHSALANYSVHYVDLPGFGHSPAIEGELDSWVDAIMEQVPATAIWMGWSLGGLVASRAAIRYPERVTSLVTIASSPCFVANEEEDWPGIAPKVLQQFFSQLGQDPTKTIDRFLAIQAMGSEHAKQDIQQIRQLVLAKDMPTEAVLTQGLMFLKNVDLRADLAHIKQPWLRLWGRLDSLVPNKVHTKLPSHHQDIEDIVFPRASHAPFISHPETFFNALLPWLAAR